MTETKTLIKDEEVGKEKKKFKVDDAALKHIAKWALAEYKQG